MDGFRKLFAEAPPRTLSGHWHLRHLVIAVLPAILLTLLLEPKRRQLLQAKQVR